MDQYNNDITTLPKEIALLFESQKKERLDISNIKSQLGKVIELKILDRKLLNLLVDRIEVSKSGE